MVDYLVFAIAGIITLGGAIGVVTRDNPVHSALCLVASFFGIAVLFVDLDAHFLAAVQVIVYAGAIVVLFLFVIMLLGVDKADDLHVEPLAGQRVAAVITGIGLLAAAVAAFLLTRSDTDEIVTGSSSLSGALDAGLNIEVLGRSIFTDNLFAFEITSVLLVIAVVGAVVLARTPRTNDAEEEVDA